MNKSHGRYQVPSFENYEPDSNNTVLKNLLHIKSAEKMAIAEEQELKRCEIELLTIFDENHQFTADDICNIHELWLGDIYPFAGKYRTVSISKDNFPFAAASRIKPLMLEFEMHQLKAYTPCHHLNTDELARALAITHIEFILIHPFREGNGRTGRLLANLMAMQANRPPINFNLIDQTKNQTGYIDYIQAIHAGFNKRYDPMTSLFISLIEDTLA